MNEINNDLTRKRTKKQILSTSILEHGKIPPQEISLEEAVLGAIMLEKDALSSVIDLLHSKVFYKDAHQKIFDAIMDLFNKNEPIDILTVTNQLRKNGELDMSGGPYYITQLTSRVASSANIEYHTRIILQKHMQRELIRISSDVIRDAFDDTSDVFDLLDTAKNNIETLENNYLIGNDFPISEITTNEIETVKNRIESFKNKKIIGIPTGLQNLDRIINGWQAAYIIVSGRTSMGKTAITLWATRKACEEGKCVKFYSLEMLKEQLIGRINCSVTGIDIDKYNEGDLNNVDLHQINEAKKKIDKWNLHINDSSNLYSEDICRDAKAFNNKKKIDLIVIDNMQKINSRVKGDTNTKITDISNNFANLYKSLKIPVIVISHMSRESDRRGAEHKPRLSDLRGSGSQETDACKVIFVYRPSYYGEKHDKKTDLPYPDNYVEIIVSKNRGGRLGTARATYNEGMTRFYDYITDYNVNLAASVDFSKTKNDDNDTPF